MPWLIIILGFLLVLGGGASAIHGYPYMQIEFGWTEVIAGTTALSAGVLTIAIGAVLNSLAALRRLLERRTVPPGVVSSTPVVVPNVPRPSSATVPPRAEILKPPAPVPVVPQASPVLDAPRPDVEVLKSSPAIVPPVSEPPNTPEAPTVVGHHSSGGSSYALFSDGTIEVTSETGLHRFDSMEELKAFMAKQDPVAAEADTRV